MSCSVSIVTIQGIPGAALLAALFSVDLRAMAYACGLVAAGALRGVPAS